MTTGEIVRTAPAPGGHPTAPAGAATPAVPLLARPGFVLVAVLATWTAVPSLVAPPKLTWALTAALLALVLNAVWWHLRDLRWTTPVTLLAVVLTCAVLSTPHFGTMTDLTSNGATALLVLGCALLAAHCGRADVELLVRGLVILAMVQLLVAMAGSVLGMPAPWGYLGTPGTTFETNPLLPAAGGRSTGTMSHPIPFGTVMAIAAALCVPRTTGWRPPVRLAIAAACCYGVALSGSRSAALALALALLAAVLIPGVLRIHTAWRAVAVLALGAVMLAVNASRLPVVTGLQGTGSLTHRLAALDAARRLAERSPIQTLFGSGAGSLNDLFAAGLLQLDGFFAVDNQLVATFATGGLVGAVALVSAVAVGLLRGHRASRPAALLLVIMFGSFDVLEWTATAVLVAVLVCLGTGRRPDGEQGGEPGTATTGSSSDAVRSMQPVDTQLQHRTRQT